MSAIAEALAQIPIFSLLDEQERETLASHIEEVELEKGKTVFETGDPGDSMFVLRSGAVEVYVKNKTGERVTLERNGPGDFFGEISLLDAGPRTASAVVTEGGHALVIDRNDLDELFRLKPAAALDLLGATGRRLRATAMLLRNQATRNVNAAVEDKRTIIMRVADGVAAFSGSIEFLILHIVIFFVWIIFNVHVLPWGNFDPFPFGLLTMVVSLEAIILSTLLLFSSNRQAAHDKVQNDIEYEVNLKAELQIQHLHEKLDKMNAEVLKRLAVLEKLSPLSQLPKPAQGNSSNSPTP
jgi:uncharacterized membrane protein